MRTHTIHGVVAIALACTTFTALAADILLTPPAGGGVSITNAAGTTTRFRVADDGSITAPGLAAVPTPSTALCVDIGTGTVGTCAALRFRPDVTSPNLLGGHVTNSITSGVAAAVVAGGGLSGNFNPNAGASCGTSCANRVTDFGGSVGGGVANQAGDGLGTTSDKAHATVSGGFLNTASNSSSTDGGGSGNTASGGSSTVAGGTGNTASANLGFIGGGAGNAVSGTYGVLVGGSNNTVSGDAGTVGGGSNNAASGAFNGTVCGGSSNSASGSYATVGGGNLNVASGNRSMVPGGDGNIASGFHSFAAGRQARTQTPDGLTIHDGAFVWADGSSHNFHSTAANEFSARATGGVRFVTAIDPSGNPVAGVAVAGGGGAWASLSDAGAKADFAAVDARQVLEKVAALPIRSWRYKAQDPSIRHIGPTAQDFRAAFAVGESDLAITTVDADGVALAAIQGLHQRVVEKERRIEAQEARIAELTRLVESMAKRLEARQP